MKVLSSLLHSFSGDNSLVFSNECTIGEVGLNEIRLVPIAEARHGTTNNFSSADLGRMKAGTRNSYAAPTTSTTNGHPIRNGHAAKSQYSSTNSLSSVESAPRPLSATASVNGGSGLPVAPIRKKRAAPRPPPQNVIPEDSPIRHMSFYVSSPNLSQSLSLPPQVEEEATTTPRKQKGTMRPMSMFHETPLNDSTTDLAAARPLSRTSSNGSESTPLQIPRRNKKSAPAPPPRTRDSGPVVPAPIPTPRNITPVPVERLEQKRKLYRSS